MADAPPSYGPSPGPPPTYPAPGSEASGGAIPMVSEGNAGFSETQAPLPAREAAAQAPISPGALADGTGAHPPRRDARDEAIFALQESFHVVQSDLFSLRSTARALERARAEIVAGREEAASQAEEIGTLKARIAAVNTRQGDDVAQRADQGARIALLEKAARDAVESRASMQNELKVLAAAVEAYGAEATALRGHHDEALLHCEELTARLDAMPDPGMREDTYGDESADDDDDASSVASEASSTGTGATTLKIYKFTSSENAALACDMSRASINEKVPELREALAEKHTAIAELLDMSEEMYVAKKDMAIYKAANSFIKAACRAATVGTGDRHEDLEVQLKGTPFF